MNGHILGPQALAQLRRDHRKLQQLNPGLPLSRRQQTQAGQTIIVLVDSALSADPSVTTDLPVLIFDGTDFVDSGVERSIRNISGAEIAAGTESNPVRMFASPVSNLGYCVEGFREIMGPAVRERFCCGDCVDLEDVVQTHLVGGEYNVFLQFALPGLYCCNGGSVSDSTLLVLQDDGTYEATVTCSEGGEVVWTLDPSGNTLTGVHSTHGTVAVYNGRHTFSQLCYNKFDLDEATTPSNDSTCAICGDAVCVYPYIQPLNVYDGCSTTYEARGATADPLVGYGYLTHGSSPSGFACDLPFGTHYIRRIGSGGTPCTFETPYVQRVDIQSGVCGGYSAAAFADVVLVNSVGTLEQWVTVNTTLYDGGAGNLRAFTYRKKVAYTTPIPTDTNHARGTFVCPVVSGSPGSFGLPTSVTVELF